ncbi:MAG: hypothetical protein A4E19_04150 [Nitrospira sp. SG-bin1]|nr:MAG: hypothetical protein A4E19_04150 [Nitrospira sp. SG-bin1]
MTAVIIAWSVVSQSEAAEWSVAPSVGVKGVYNSNLVLTPLAHDETYGIWVTPAAEFAGKTERLDVSSRLATDVVGYFGEEERQFTNVFAPLSARYRTEKDTIGFSGGFTRDNTLLGELQETGVVLEFTQRNQWTANPTWTRRVTETLSVQSSVQFSDTAYESPRLVDYRVAGWSGGLLYQLSERDNLQLSGSYVHFRTTDSPFGFRADFPGINMSLTHVFSESLTGTVYGGPKFLSSTSQTSSGNITARDTVLVTGASMEKKFERAALHVSFARDLGPSGFGLLIQTHRGELSGSYEISETLACSFNLVGVRTSGKTQAAIGGVFPDSSYVSMAPKLSWTFFEWWQAEVSYMYRWRDVDTAADSAQSHATTFMVTYYPPKFSFSN